jgi:DNA-binding MarR family transcriptional regulator
MKQEHISELRAFNRFYTNVIGLLDRHILNSNYSLIEARIMFELYHCENVTASDIIALIEIDKGYLSRILKKFGKDKLINRISSETDKRTTTIQLSAKGKEEYEKLDNTSNKQIETLIENLSEKECAELIQKITEIKILLKSGLKNE